MDNSTCTAANAGAYPALFGALMQTLLLKQCTISPESKWPRDPGVDLLRDGLPLYDYVVVGGGTSGSVVAARLAENPQTKVLLVERGENPPLESIMPGLGAPLQRSKYAYQFFGKANACLAMVDNGCFYPRGKMLSGSHGVNMMIHFYGLESDFDEWVALGNPAWDFKTNLKYFRLSEKNQRPDFVANHKYHSGTGKMYVDDFQGGFPFLSDIFAEAYTRDWGLRFVEDFNGGGPHIGCGFSQGTQFEGERHSTARDFLTDRPNLHILRNATATKVVIQNKRAVGLEFLLDGQRRLTARAENEVILSAGSIGSPQLLMLSGIGPRRQLNALKIPVVQELPVGDHLQDHPGVLVFYEFHRSSPQTVEPDYQSKGMFEYITSRTGMYATIPASFHAFINTNRKSKDPNIQIMHFGFKKNSKEFPAFLNSRGFKPEIKDILNRQINTTEVGFALIILSQPDSLGSVKLGGPSIFDDPDITLNYFEERKDMETMVAAVRSHVELTAKKTLKKHEARIVDLKLPACDQFGFLTDEYYRCFIRHSTMTLFHPVGTC